MFNVGTGELVLIMVLALIVLGPDKLPNAARQAGKWMAEVRRLSSGFQQEFRDAVDSAVSMPSTVDRNNGSHDLGTGGFSLPSLDVRMAPEPPPAEAEPEPEPEPEGPAGSGPGGRGTIDLDGPSGSFS
jgi:sec-independent protein translocase protein TatB